MKTKFLVSIFLSTLWLIISLSLAISWAQEISYFLPIFYIWWTIIGVALLPGFLMSCMFFSNLLNGKLKSYHDTCEDTTIIMCARNEGGSISKAIECIFQQKYLGNIRLIIIDNVSTDNTKQEIFKMKKFLTSKCSLEYVICDKLGKWNALNLGLSMVKTPHFLTVDADTFLTQTAVQKIMNSITFHNSACTAGNLFVKNSKTSLMCKMQHYDYLLSIAAVKRFQGSYNSTLVAQGSFSAYDTKAIKELGGWKDFMGEDIVLTYEILEKNLSSTYESQAIAYTLVPEELNSFYNQRKRWAIGMLEGLFFAPPWKQGTVYSKYFTFTNLSVLYLDFAFLFGFIPGIVLAFCGCFYFAGFLTLINLINFLLIFTSFYIYQKGTGAYFENDILGFIFFLLFFQFIQSTASLHGYIVWLMHKKEQWK